MNVYIRKKDLDYSAMRGPCPEGFHVPHYKEWQAIIDIWLELGLPEQDGELYATYLKLPFAGERGSSGTLTDQTQLGYYWSSPSNDDSFFFWIGHYDDPTATTFGWRAVARSLRAFKDVPAKPDSSWTVIYDGSAVATGAGIFWNATLGLISLSSDGFSRKTIQDKNLGATNVGDYGSHFQRGNNYGFPSSGTLSDTSSTQVDASGYGPGNYYSSSTYITGSEDWSSVRNDNLWGHSTGTVPIMTTMKNAYVGQGIWRPGENTVAYRPLTSTTTVNDQSGNEYNLTQTGGSFTTLDGVDCFYNGGSTTGYFNLTSAPLIPSGNAARTISLWTNFSSLGSRYVLSYGSQNGTGTGLNLQTSTSYSFVNIIGKTLRGPDISTGVRYLHTITTEGNEIKYYVNGELQATNTDTTINTSAITSSLPFRLMRVNNSTSTSYQTRGYLSEVIIENRTWTATEIVNYFNDNKEKYGL